MYGILYAAICITLANLAYKSQSNKARIAASPKFAVFVAFWMLLFVVLFFVPAWKFLSINYSLLPVFIVTTILWFASPWFVRRFGHEPKQFMHETGTKFLISFLPHALFAKYFEILCQQGLFVYTLVVILQGQSEIMRIFWFLVMNALIHLANLLFLEKKETMRFFYLSLPMAIFFGYLILHGYILVTASIHMLFYLLLDGSYWFKKKAIK